MVADVIERVVFLYKSHKLVIVLLSQKQPVEPYHES